MPINNYEINSALSTQEQKSGGKFWLVILLLIVLAGLYYMYDNKKAEAPVVKEPAMAAPIAEEINAKKAETMNSLSADIDATFATDTADMTAIDAEFKK